MEGKSVVPTEITYMDTEDIQIDILYLRITKIHIFKLLILYLRITKIHVFKLHIYCILRSPIHIFKSIFRFPISSLGLPNFSFSEKLRGSVGKIYRRRSNINQTEPYYNFNTSFSKQYFFSTSCFLVYYTNPRLLSY
jgi:hypothetical protein